MHAHLRSLRTIYVPRPRLLGALLTLALFTVLAVPAAHAWTNGQAAKLVLGQPDFTTGTPPTSVSASKLHDPRDVAIDPTTGKVFVADSKNNRVLRFAALPSLTNGAAAEGVLGQPNFITNTANIGGRSASTLFEPGGLAVDDTGRLWVADISNSRVLRFDAAASKPNGAPADGVLGQPDFTSSNYGTSATRMNRPYDVAVDSAGRLWVTDNNNQRVLRFDAAASKPNGAPADGVLGQPDFTTGTSNTGGLSARTLNNPHNLTVDSAGRLWVADIDNHRVLRFDAAASKPNGAPADGVFGQPDFTSSTVGTSASTMSQPAGVAVDAVGRLWVTDLSNNRMLRFDAAASKPNGAPADGVLGQPNFITNTIGTSATKMNYPVGVTVDNAGHLWVADLYNYRVLLFQGAVMQVQGKGQVIANGDSTPTTADDTDFGDVLVGQTATHTFTISNIDSDQGLSLTGTPPVVIGGAAASDFAIVSQPDTAIAANGSTTFDVRFTPSAAGIRSATISIANDASGNYTFAVQGAGMAGPTFTSGAPPAGTYGTFYSHTFMASGYPNPTFSVSSGTAPPGLSLNSATGVLSGTPTEVGTFNFTVTASNNLGSVDQQVTLIINKANYRSLLPLIVQP